MADKKNLQWQGYPIVNENDADDLEREAALNEFERKLPRKEAEAKAHEDYKRKHHAKAAAYHLSGIKVAQALGNMAAAKQHGALYEMHVRALGHNPYDAVPAEIKAHTESPDEQDYKTKFKPHKADTFLLSTKL